MSILDNAAVRRAQNHPPQIALVGGANVDAAVERRRVAAGGMLALPIFCGDEITLVDPAGLQVAHVAAFDHCGKSITAALGIAENTDASGIARCLAIDTPDARRLGEKLKTHGIDLTRARVAELLGGESADAQTSAGNSVSFISQVDALCLFAAPGEDLVIDAGLDAHADGGNLRAQIPPTELVVFVRRNHGDDARTGTGMESGNAAEKLPDPLADPREEIRITHSTAVAYQVAAGEYIQVIDVAGRQCSDFQCFDGAKLEAGIERCIEATTTRSLMGAAYPQPGLYGKFYDLDFEPVIEVVQDTCGRHDSFGLACTDKYYDDAGYPGHVNCSDNFNRALSPYSIAPRRGWTAMNLFFNTFFDDAHQYAFDDPWSRPGDYVLLRALKDMVCVSSACPCDIDPANGWNPTDIHLRLYSHKEMFRQSIAYRKTPDAEPDMTQQTGFHSRTAALTRNFTEYNGYWLANDFTNLGGIAEYWACREGVVITDLSPLRKAEVVGPDAELLLQTCVTRDIRRLSAGQVVYTAMCHESGGMIDDGTVFRLRRDNLRWVGGNDHSIEWLRKQAVERGLNTWVKDSTEQLHNLQVQGPRSLDVLREIIWTRPDQARIDELAWFRFSIARIGDADGIPVVVSRTGYTGERGYEIFCHPKHAEQVWDAIWQAGQAHDIKPLGLEALDILRIEAGLIFVGNEFCDQTDPFEAGIGFTVPLKTKQDDFIGRDALLRRKTGARRKLVGLEVDGQVAEHGDGVYVGRNQVGEITSGVASPILRKNIALCRLDIEHAELDTQVEVGKLDGHQKRIPCRVVPFPHYDPTKSRVRGE